LSTILSKLDEYRRAVQTLGLTTRNTNLSFFLKSKSIMFAGAASLCSIVSGAPDALLTVGGIAAMGWKLMDFCVPIRLVGKTPVGETPTGATETVALPGTQKLSVKRIGMDFCN
jgi:hypothetical protein